jgi:hypothetical protein
MRRTLLVPLLSTRGVVLFGAMILALALIALAVGTSAKQADAATRLVTKTFTNSGQILIPKGSVFAAQGSECTGNTSSGKAAPYPSEKSVSAFPTGSHIRDVNLTLKKYSFNDVPQDVDVLLAHSGKNRTVMSDVGTGLFVDNINLVLDDEATNGLRLDEGQLAGGRFRPSNLDGGDFFPAPAPTPNTRSALSGFDGQNPNNTWRLFVRDDSDFDCGKFGGGWSITIKAAVPA